MASDLKIKNKICIPLPYFFLCLFMGFLYISGQLFFIISLKCCYCYCSHYSIIFYTVFHITVVFKDSSVCLLTRLRDELRNCSLIPGRGNTFFSSPKCPDLLNRSPHSYSTDAREFFPGVIEAKAQPDHSTCS